MTVIRTIRTASPQRAAQVFALALAFTACASGLLALGLGVLILAVVG